MSISVSPKIQLMRSFITSIFLYACELWTLTAETQRKIKAMEMRCYRKILHISYKDHITTRKSVPRSSRQMDVEKHISRSLDLAKTILQGSVKGERRQGRQWKRWEDTIREWTGLVFAKSQRAVKNRGKWKKLVVKSSVVPQRPSRLRDR